MGPRDYTQVVRLGGKYPYLMTLFGLLWHFPYSGQCLQGREAAKGSGRPRGLRPSRVLFFLMSSWAAGVKQTSLARAGTVRPYSPLVSDKSLTPFFCGPHSAGSHLPQAFALPVLPALTPCPRPSRWLRACSDWVLASPRCHLAEDPISSLLLFPVLPLAPGWLGSQWGKEKPKALGSG